MRVCYLLYIREFFSSSVLYVCKIFEVIPDFSTTIFKEELEFCVGILDFLEVETAAEIVIVHLFTNHKDIKVFTLLFEWTYLRRCWYWEIDFWLWGCWSCRLLCCWVIIGLESYIWFSDVDESEHVLLYLAEWNDLLMLVEVD